MKTKGPTTISTRVLLCLTVLLCGALSAPAQMRRANGTIAFTSMRDGNPEIYLYRPAWPNQVRLTNNEGVDDHPAWSPDGTKIAFVSEYGSGVYAIFTMNADGTNKVLITPINYNRYYTSLSWSPDGKRIVFLEYRDVPNTHYSQSDLVIVNVDDGTRQDLTNDPDWDSTPSWSPDGSRILFSRYLTGNNHFGLTLLTIKPDGTDLRELANGLGNDGWDHWSAKWSPSGDKIVFVSNVSDFEQSIFIANADGTNSQLFDSCNGSYCELGRDNPAWSPDGQWIIFSIEGAIHMKNVDGTGFQVLVSGTNPSWQPVASTCASPNPIDCPDFFIGQQYRDFLGREPDASGFQNWMTTLTACENGGFGEFDNPYCDRVHVSAGFFQSNEFLARGYWLLRVGYVGLNRSITDSSTGRSQRSSLSYANEFIPGLQQIGGSNSPQQEEAAKAAYINAFVQRANFQQLFPNSDSNSVYVDKLESNAGVTVPNKQQLIDGLNAGTKTRAQVLLDIVESQVVFDKYIIPSFVDMEYKGYLRRDPDAIGYNNWIETLTADPSNYRHMVFGFIYSTEYRGRFGAP